MPNNVTSVSDRIIANISRQVTELRRSKLQANTPCRLDEAGDITQEISRIVETKIRAGLNEVTIMGKQKLRKRLSVRLHPDKISNDPELWPCFQPISLVDGNNMILINIPQQTINQILQENPLHYDSSSAHNGTHPTTEAEYQNPAPGDEYPEYSENFPDELINALSSFLEGFGYLFSQYHRYPKSIKILISYLNKVIDLILGFVLAAFPLFAIAYNPSLYLLTFLLLCAHYWPMILFSNKEVINKDNFCSLSPIKKAFRLVYEELFKPLPEEGYSQKSLAIAGRCFKAIVAPIWLLGTILLDLEFHLLMIALLPVLACAAMIKILSLIIINFPFYVYDVLQHIIPKNNVNNTVVRQNLFTFFQENTNKSQSEIYEVSVTPHPISSEARDLLMVAQCLT